jgi:NitT/TauT family transport system substrate-binding protein
MDKKTTRISLDSDPTIENLKSKIENRRVDGWSRRDFLNAVTLAGTGTLLGLRSDALAAEPPPETTRIKLVYSRGLCLAPLHVAEQFLKSEGFTEVQYLPKGRVEANKALASGEAQITMAFNGNLSIQVDAGDPVVILAGVHPGCYELFSKEPIRFIRDLKGKSVAVTDLGSGRHLFLASMLTHVGLNPNKDVNFVTYAPAEAIRLFTAGKIDAFLANPPEPQELRAKKVGHLVVNSMMDKPWSQYFCCMLAANREFVRKYPVATKRATRAILKAADVCGREPDRIAQLLVDKGHTNSYEVALQTMKEMGMAYRTWREYDAEDTVRFYALRLQEIGMIKSSPQKIIAQGTDWRFLRELKKEMKA